MNRPVWTFPEAPHGQPTREQQHPLGTRRGTQIYCRAGDETVGRFGKIVAKALVEAQARKKREGGGLDTPFTPNSRGSAH